MSQSKSQRAEGRAYFWSILAMFGFLGLVGTGAFAMIRVASKPQSS